MGIVAKYKFDGSVYADLIPEFNAEFTNYNITDEVEGNIITRTIESDSLPTLMRFGSNLETYVEGSEIALLEVLEMDTSGLTSCNRMFRYCTNLTSIICDWDTTKVTNMNAMFRNCSSLINLDVSNFNTSKVADMNDMFRNCSSLINLDVSNFNTSNVTTMMYMFSSCKNLVLLDVSGFDTSNVTNMYSMFSGCSKLTSLEVSKFDTSKVTLMNFMFYSCSGLISLDLSNFDTTKVTRINDMFNGCTSLTSLDLSGFDTTNVLDMNDMFRSCSNLTSLDLSDFDIANATTMTDMFYNCNILKYLKCNNVNTLNTLNTYLPTKTSDNQGTIICKLDIASLDTDTLQSKYWTVNTNPTLIAKYKYDSKIYKNTIPVFNDGYMGFVEDEEIDENGVVTRKIEHVELPTLMRFGQVYVDGEIVNNQSKSLLQVLDMNISKLTTFNSMFRHCISLVGVACVWDIHPSANNMNNMFQYCYSLSELDMSNCNVSKVNLMFAMFNHCYKLHNLDLSRWDMRNVSNMSMMFNNCQNLSRLDISNLDTSNKLTDTMLNNTLILTDIGMIYCDKDTINKVASLLPNNVHRTIWVESDDILQYDQYDHITYKTQKVQDTVHLNSPLLMGDTIEVIDGKTYHVHRYEKFVFDGNLNVDNLSNCVDGVNKYYNFVIPINQTIHPKPTGNNQISDKLLSGNPYTTKNTFWILAQNTNMEFRLNIENLKTVDEYKQYLQANPVTVVYELATPIYELISEEPLELTLLDTTDNTINNNSILPSNMSIANKELSTIAIKPSTTYTLAFDKSIEDSEVTIDICGGEQVTTVGNMVQLTTPSELDSGIRFISGDGCIVSNVRLIEGGLVEKAIPKESFEGLQNSFEDGYIIGENLANEKEDYFYEENGNYGNTIIDFKRNLKANTTYTLVRKISNVKYGLLNGISFYDMAYYTDGTQKQDHNCWYGKDGWYISKYTPTKDVTRFAFIIGNDNHNNGNIRPRIVISDYMIFEGDHTHLSEAELMRYIEKGTSHYEEEDFNHVGKYKVQYKVSGKNKFDINNTLTCNHPHTIEDNSFSYSPTEWNRYGYLNIDNIQGEKGYKMSWENIGVGVYFITFNCYNGDVLIGQITNNYGYLFTLPNTTRIEIIFKNNSITSGVQGFKNFQLEEGTEATPYEPYKEDIKTYYLSSPLLEGDTIEDVSGIATHVKRYGKVVLDGSESWNTNVNGAYWKNFGNGKVNGVLLTNTMDKKQLNWQGNFVVEPFNNLNTVDNFKQWLSEHPTTIVYELASSQYEPISTESILCDSYVNGHLNFDTDIPIEKVEFSPTSLVLDYLQPSTSYIVQFESDNIGEILFSIGGTDFGKYTVHKGLNKFYGITNSSLTNDRLWMSGIGFNASNIQVVANALDDNGEVKEFDYFKGLKSSFEDGLITDENDENYGKYKVECKIVGKNKFDGEIIKGKYINNYQYDYSVVDNTNTSIVVYKIDKLTPITISTNDIIYCHRIEDMVGNLIKGSDFSYNKTQFTYTPKQTDCVLKICLPNTTTNFQIEEGTQATEYEPYKESIHTLYLNSPLLKEDKIVVHDGKLCHYHKMGMVVFDGSEDEGWKKDALTVNYTDNSFIMTTNQLDMQDSTNAFYDIFDIGITDNLPTKRMNSEIYNNTQLNMNCYSSGWRQHFICLKNISSLEAAKQWLQQNPTTVVYKLAEPYYEPIEPQVSQYSLPSVKDGDMEIITALPIEIDLTYRTDINGTTTLEEELANAQSSTDLTDIINSEVDE